MSLKAQLKPGEDLEFSNCRTVFRLSICTHGGRTKIQRLQNVPSAQGPVWWVVCFGLHPATRLLTAYTDEGKPECERCAKAGIQCEGYPSRLQWINEGPRLAKEDQSASKEGALQLSPKPPTTSTTDPPPAGPSLPTNTPPLRDEMLSTYLYEHFRDNLGGYTYGSWIKDTLKEARDSSAQLALHALAAVFFATQNHNDHAAMQHAGTLYGRALRTLNQSLVDPQTCYSYSNVSAVFALNLYEFYASTEAFGWVQHAGGISSLMRILGPAYFSHYPAHGLFLLARSTMITRSYRLREPCFLAEEAWTTVPWQYHPETLDGQHSILSLMASIPSLHARCMEIDDAAPSTDTEQLAHQVEEIKVDAIKLGKGIIRWRMEWEAKHPACAWEIQDPSGNIASDEEGNSLFGNMLWFSKRERCVEILLYNSAMAAVVHFQRRYPPGTIKEALLEDWPAERLPPLTNKLLLPNNAMHPLQCATEICKTVNYALTGRTDHARYLDLLLPLGIR